MGEVSEIQAAGAIVWRRNESDAIEIALVHRPKYDDWSIPKGKVEGEESLIACAYREVVEETGFAVRFGQSLGSAHYEVNGLPKTVTYWSARLLGEQGKPNPEEVDAVRWMSCEEAKEQLGSDSDRQIVETFQSIEPDTKPLILLRHAKAIERQEWAGEDTDRPLSSLGERQAKRMLTNFLPFAVEEIHSSSAVRCYESITPLARGLNVDFFFTDSLTEEVFHKNNERPFKYVQRLLVNDFTTLVCSHNPILPSIVSAFVDKFGVEVPSTKLEPGDAWVAHHVEREVVAIDFLPAPKA
ncbi:MAG: NUDIX hydrolase [Actinobacteria bacterium]|nr:NUDIX hydrolase [Actinomycetota bacterium]NDE53154.1 NUDIX hydrolase [Actinomycetota bacterium]